MARIYKRSDRIKISIEDKKSKEKIVITIAPMSYHQKMEAQSLMLEGTLKQNQKAKSDGIIKLLKYSLKDITGLEDSSGKPYELKFENDELLDECIDELLTIQLNKELVMICSNLMGSIPEEFVDQYGNKLEGVEFVQEKGNEPDPN